MLKNTLKSFETKVKEILLNPSSFFKKAKKEQGIHHPIRFLIVFLLITQIFIVFYYFKNVFTQYGWNFQLSITNYILVYIVLTVFTLIISFIRPALTNFFIRWFSKENKFEDTYKAMIYGLTPDYIATPFLIITMIFLSATILLQNNWYLVIFIISAFITLVAAFYTLYLRMYGVSKLHKISMWKAFLCIYIFPVLLIIGLEILVLIIIYVYFLVKFKLTP